MRPGRLTRGRALCGMLLLLLGAGAACLAPRQLSTATISERGAADEQARRLRIDRMQDYFPNTPLVTHDGRPVRFYDDLVQDRCVLIQFMYTSCGGT